MLVGLTCALLIAGTTLIHYEVLRALNARLPGLAIPPRTKVLVVVFVTFAAHALEIIVYAAALLLLLTFGDVGTLQAQGGLTLVTCLYYSAETYTALGFGDIMPVGPVRVLAGVEALNGLLLIG